MLMGYSGPGCTSSLSNSLGRTALLAALRLCKDVVSTDLKLPRKSLIGVDNVGGSGNDLCSYRYHMYEDRENDSIPNRRCIWESLHDGLENVKAGGVGSQKTTPDVALWNVRDGVRKYPLVAEVKNYTKAQTSKSCPEQTWIQALVGLKELDVTCGVLFEATRIMLYQLTKEDGNNEDTELKELKNLNTRACLWNLRNSRNDMFNIDQFMDFMKTVICIMANIKD